MVLSARRVRSQRRLRRLFLEPLEDRRLLAVYAFDDFVSTAPETTVGGGVLGNDYSDSPYPVWFDSASSPSNGSFSIDPWGNFSYTPNPGFTGIDGFSYTAYSLDNDGVEYLYASASVTIEVGTPPPSTINDDAYSINIGATLTVAASGVLANDYDPEGDSLSASLVSGTSYGSLAFNSDGSFTYTPDPGFFGSDGFSYSNSADPSLTGGVTITILDPPSASDDFYTLGVGETLQVPASGILGNDSGSSLWPAWSIRRPAAPSICKGTAASRSRRSRRSMARSTSPTSPATALSRATRPRYEVIAHGWEANYFSVYINADMSESAVGVNIVSYDLDFMSDGTYEVAGLLHDELIYGTSQEFIPLSVIGTNPAIGSYPLTIRAVLSNGEEQEYDTAIELLDTPPDVGVYLTDESINGGPFEVQLEILLQGDDVLGAGEIDWGDGSIDLIGAGQTQISHEYAQDGTYSIIVDLSDSDGQYSYGPFEVTGTRIDPFTQNVPNPAAAYNHVMQQLSKKELRKYADKVVIKTIREQATLDGFWNGQITYENITAVNSYSFDMGAVSRWETRERARMGDGFEVTFDATAYLQYRIYTNSLKPGSATRTGKVHYVFFCISHHDCQKQEHGSRDRTEEKDLSDSRQ